VRVPGLAQLFASAESARKTAAAPQRPAASRPSPPPAAAAPTRSDKLANAADKNARVVRPKPEVQTPAPTPAPAPRVEQAVVRRAPTPSFDCRSASSRREDMVCGNEQLASLDRSVSRLYQAALGTADDETRYQLQRTRARFQGYLDSCRTESCVARVYQVRMAEIRQIISQQ
jgi:hypothetical protein